MSALDNRDLDGLASRLARVEEGQKRIEATLQRIEWAVGRLRSYEHLDWLTDLVDKVQNGLDHGDPKLGSDEERLGFLKALSAVMSQGDRR